MSEHHGDSYHGDRIFLRGLTAQCIIGFIDWERRTPQTLMIDLEIPCDCSLAARHDRVEDTVDYKRVAKRVLAWLPETQFHLVETLAHQLALLLLAEFSLAWVRVSVNKPGAIRDSRDVGVSLERRRADLV
ncbi:MAG TPA: dihydroneopterin aldolase [Steroidobacteraceae bacterium]|jgi:dihydroneopterin aldolase